MKKLMLVISLLLVAGYVGAAECVKPPELDPNTVPFAYDPNSAPAWVIGWQEMSAGGESGGEVSACDPDGDQFIIEPVSMPLGMVWDANTNWWTWTPEPNQIGLHWVVFGVTDIPAAGTDGAKTDIAAKIIKVSPRFNNPPCILDF